METTCTMPLLGYPFPNIKAQSTSGPISLPEDSRGKWLVFFSHPADFTPVCTTEFVAFQNRLQKFAALNAMLVGLSVDQVFSHIKWLDWIQEKLGVNIEFPVIADDRGEIAMKLGMIHPGKGNNTVRAVFLVDLQGMVRLMLYYPQEVGRNMDEILRALEALQISDSRGCAMPAGWPHNELIENRVIVPPAGDRKSAGTRLKEYEGFDWWFCHKEL